MMSIKQQGEPTRSHYPNHVIN